MATDRNCFFDAKIISSLYRSIWTEVLSAACCMWMGILTLEIVQVRLELKSLAKVCGFLICTFPSCHLQIWFHSHHLSFKQTPWSVINCVLSKFYVLKKFLYFPKSSMVIEHRIYETTVHHWYLTLLFCFFVLAIFRLKKSLKLAQNSQLSSSLDIHKAKQLPRSNYDILLTPFLCCCTKFYAKYHLYHNNSYNYPTSF